MGTNLVPLIAMLLIQALSSLASMAIPVVVPEAAAEIGVPASLVGVFVGLVYLAAMWASLLSGGYILRYGAIRISQLGLVACAAGLLVFTSGSPWLLVASALLIGMGYGPITPAGSHVLARTTPSHLRGLIFSIRQTGVPLGGALAGVLVPPLIVVFGWRGSLIAVALACVASAWLSQSTQRELDTDLKTDQVISLRSLVGP